MHASVPALVTMEKFRIIVFACVAALLWAAIEVIGAWLPDAPSGYEIVWVRYATHLLFMLVVLSPRFGSALFKTTRPLSQLGRGLLMLGMPIFFIIGTHYLSLVNIWSVFWLMMLATMLLAMLLLHERTAWPVWLATGVAFVGVVLLMHPHRTLLGPAILLPIGMGACFGLYLVSIRMLHSESLLPSLFYTALAVFVPLSFGLPAYWSAVTLPSIGGMVLIGFLGLLLLYSLDKALAVGSIGLAVPFLLSAPLWMLLFDALIFHVHIQAGALLGSLLLIGALICLAIYQLHAETLVSPTVRLGESEL